MLDVRDVLRILEKMIENKKNQKPNSVFDEENFKIEELEKFYDFLKKIS